MARYMLSYDLHNITNTNIYTTVRNEIQNRFPTSLEILNTTYLIKSTDNLITVNTAIKAILDRNAGESNHEFYVVVVADGSGWLAPNKVNWISQNFR
jgi:hypothetical protein